MRVREKREAQLLFEEQMTQRENDWKIRLESAESELLAHQLRVSSLTSETEKLREDRKVKGHIVESSETAQRQLEKELKQSRWELEDYRAMCTRRIQDLESQIAFTEQSQKTLVEKYERKLVQAETRLQEISVQGEKVKSAHNDAIRDLNNSIRTFKESLSDKETEIARLQWKIEDLTLERTKNIEDNALNVSKLQEQIANLQAKDDCRLLKEEINHLKKCLNETKLDLAARIKDVEKYQMELVSASDQIAEAERQRARQELECQQKCDKVQREQYEKSEKLISRLSQAKDRAEATVKRLEKESALHQQAISGLKKDRDDAYSTLRAHGLGVDISKPASPRANVGLDTSEVSSLRLQNDNLKQVISQMRHEMEHVSASKINIPLGSAPRQPDIYVKSLEEEIQELKQQLRQNERAHLKSPYTMTDMMKAINSGDNPAIQEVVASLNATISSLRTEKVELMTNGRKAQVELESLKRELQMIKQGPRDTKIELEQARYELNSVTRKLESETSFLKQRIAELETQLGSCREEAAEYHRSLLNANEELQAVSTELSTLKMSHARSDNVINYGAQELVIQNLQDEVNISFYVQ